MAQNIIDKSIWTKDDKALANKKKRKEEPKGQGDFLSATDNTKLDELFISKKRKLFGKEYVNMQRAMNLMDLDRIDIPSIKLLNPSEDPRNKELEKINPAQIQQRLRKKLNKEFEKLLQRTKRNLRGLKFRTKEQ
jgi:hypothetical protein